MQLKIVNSMAKDHKLIKHSSTLLLPFWHHIANFYDNGRVLSQLNGVKASILAWSLANADINEINKNNRLWEGIEN